MSYNFLVLYFYTGYLVLMSLISLCLFIKDKKLAIRNEERIREKTLLSSSIFGGAIGAYFGRKIARHKTRKSYFTFTIVVSLILQISVLAVLLFLAII